MEIGPKSQVFEKQRMVNSLKLLKDEEWNHWKEFSSRAKITRNFKLLSLQEFWPPQGNSLIANFLRLRRQVLEELIPQANSAHPMSTLSRFVKCQSRKLE